MMIEGYYAARGLDPSGHLKSTQIQDLRLSASAA
jgi:hypothetical protein